MQTVQAKSHMYRLPLAAQQFNKLKPSKQAAHIDEQIQPFYKPTTAFIFYYEMCVIAVYGSERWTQEIKLMNIYAVSHKEGRYKMENTPGAKFFWHYLEPNRKTSKFTYEGNYNS